MTFRTWLRGRLLDLLNDPPASPPSPPSSSPESNPSSPTQNGKHSAPTSGELAILPALVEMMATNQREMMREMRGMVMDILQGREYTGTAAEAADQEQVSRTRFDPPDYDAPGTDDLPEGLAAVWERHDQEDIQVATSMNPGELLNAQLERARRQAMMDPQGPSSIPSFSTESLGLQWPPDQTT